MPGYPGDQCELVPPLAPGYSPRESCRPGRQRRECRGVRKEQEGTQSRNIYSGFEDAEARAWQGVSSCPRLSQVRSHDTMEAPQTFRNASWAYGLFPAGPAVQLDNERSRTKHTSTHRPPNLDTRDPLYVTAHDLGSHFCD